MTKLSETLHEALQDGGGILARAMSDLYRDGFDLDESEYPIGTKRKRGDGRIWVKIAGVTGAGMKNWMPESSNKPAASADEALEAQGRPLPTGRKWIEHVPGLPTETSRKWKGKDGMYKADRAAMHERTIQSFLGKAKPVPMDQKPIALFTMGITASGKTTTRNKMKLPFGDNGAVIVDPDALKETIPEYQVGIALSARDSAFMAHDESSDIAHELGKRALSERKNTIFDGTGKSLEKMQQAIKRAKDAGFHVMAMMPHVSTNEAKRRADHRAETEGRYVPHDIIEDAAGKVPGSFLKLMGDFDEAQLFDHQELGQPKLMYSKEFGKEPKVEDDALFSNFKKSAGVTEWLTNPRHRVAFDMRGAVMEQKKEKKDLKPAASMKDLSKAFMDGAKEAATESAKLPKKFKKGEGVKTPLND